MSAFDDYCVVRDKIAADIRTVFGFTQSDHVYLSPREMPPQAGSDRYATVLLQEPISVDYQAGGAPSSALLNQRWLFGIAVRLRRESSETRDDRASQLAFAFVNKLHEPVHYADVSSLHIVRSFGWHGGDAQDQWLTIEVQIELTVIEPRWENLNA